MKRQHPDNPELFWCPKCETYKDRGEFHKGHMEACKGCRKKVQLPKQCQRCGNTFTPIRGFQLYCLECKKKKIDAKPCKLCGNMFIPNHSPKLHCDECLSQRRSEIKNNSRSEYYIKNKVAIEEYREGYWRDNKEKRKVIGLRYIHNSVDNITDRYAKDILSRSLPNELITPETIELKRQQITMKRTLKQFKQWREQNEPDHTDVSGVEHADEINNEGGL